jgi:hypothetical protein
MKGGSVADLPTFVCSRSAMADIQIPEEEISKEETDLLARVYAYILSDNFGSPSAAFDA